MKIVLLGKPQSTQNSYGQHGKIRYLKKEAVAMKEFYKVQAKSQYRGKPLEVLLTIDVKIYFKNNLRRDWDNRHKISMDSLEGVVYKDDSQIMDARVRKYVDKENQRIEIDILPNKE